MKKVSADIVVLSAGTAGLPAAVTAAEGGASVIVFEKAGATGGTGNRANMIFAVESRLQKEQGITLTCEEAYKAHMEWTHWRVDARLVSDFINKSASTIDWLLGMGVEFFPLTGFPGQRFLTTHIVKGTPPGPKQVGQAAAAMKILTRRAHELDVRFYLKTPARRLVKRNGRITGVIAVDENGQEIQAQARAVIIATGGFSGNKEWVKKYTGFEEGKTMFSLRLGGVNGDGIRMAWEVGAAPTEMYNQLMHHLPPPCHGGGGTSWEFNYFARPNLMVNFMGQRFVNEDVKGAHPLMANAICRQKEKTAFMIFDGDTKKHYDANPVVFPGDNKQYQTFKHADLDDNIREARGRGYKYLFMADTIEELCAQTGIAPEGLKQTIGEYNRICRQGYDDIFHKAPEYLRPVGNPKFYAARFFPGSYGTVGGIKVNHKMEVLTGEHTVIPGLYAAGNDANNIYDNTYVPLAGNYMGFAINSGRIAAESALEYLKPGR